MTADPTTGMDAVTLHLRRQAANIARQHPRCATCGWLGEGCYTIEDKDPADHYCAEHTEVQP